MQPSDVCYQTSFLLAGYKWIIYGIDMSMVLPCSRISCSSNPLINRSMNVIYIHNTVYVYIHILYTSWYIYHKASLLQGLYLWLSRYRFCSLEHHPLVPDSSSLSLSLSMESGETHSTIYRCSWWWKMLSMRCWI